MSSGHAPSGVGGAMPGAGPSGCMAWRVRWRRHWRCGVKSSQTACSSLWKVCRKAYDFCTQNAVRASRTAAIWDAGRYSVIPGVDCVMLSSVRRKRFGVPPTVHRTTSGSSLLHTESARHGFTARRCPRPGPQRANTLGCSGQGHRAPDAAGFRAPGRDVVQAECPDVADHRH